MRWTGRVVLVNPPTAIGSASYLTAPLGLAQVASALRLNDEYLEISVLDLALELAEGLLPYGADLPRIAAERLLASGGEIFAFSVQCFNLPIASAIARRLRDLKPSIKIVFGGHHITLLGNAALADLPVDLLIAGSAEKTLIPQGGPQFLSPSFDLLPDLQRYRAVSDHPTGLIEVGRGCPFNCAYCSIPLAFGRRLEHKPIESIRAEIEYWLSAGYNNLHLIDDTITVNKRRILDIINLFQPYSERVSWSVMTRADLVDKPLLRQMSSAGCSAILYGIDSASTSTLDRIHKRAVAYPNLKDLALWHKEVGILPTFYFLLDLPDDNISDALINIEVAVELSLIDPGCCRLNLTRIVPGTPLAINHSDELTLNLDAPYADNLRLTVGDNCQEVWGLIERHPRLYSTYYAKPTVFGRNGINNLARYGELLLQQVPLSLALLARIGALPQVLDKVAPCVDVWSEQKDQTFLNSFAQAVDSVSELASELIAFELWRRSEHEICVTRVDAERAVAACFNREVAATEYLNPEPLPSRRVRGADCSGVRLE